MAGAKLSNIITASVKGDPDTSLGVTWKVQDIHFLTQWKKWIHKTLVLCSGLLEWVTQDYKFISLGKCAHYMYLAGLIPCAIVLEAWVHEIWWTAAGTQL